MPQKPVNMNGEVCMPDLYVIADGNNKTRWRSSESSLYKLKLRRIPFVDKSYIFKE